jgi:hypothetical protein
MFAVKIMTVIMMNNWLFLSTVFCLVCFLFKKDPVEGNAFTNLKIVVEA